MECIKRGATVYTCNANTPTEEIKTISKNSEYIISCTGKIHLIDQSFLRDDKTQIIVDV